MLMPEYRPSKEAIMEKLSLDELLTREPADIAAIISARFKEGQIDPDFPWVVMADACDMEARNDAQPGRSLEWATVAVLSGHP